MGPEGTRAVLESLSNQVHGVNLGSKVPVDLGVSLDHMFISLFCWFLGPRGPQGDTGEPGKVGITVLIKNFDYFNLQIFKTSGPPGRSGRPGPRGQSGNKGRPGDDGIPGKKHCLF